MRAGLRSKPEGRKLMPMTITPRKITRRARGLRRAETESERRLWGYLRGRRLNGHKFVRQEPVGPYFADFMCRQSKLIVEVDGATHSDDHQMAYDVRRTAFLRQQGFNVLRIFSTDVFTNMSNVLDTILLALDGRIETG
jgi:very-short-patch-repair endonuclease